MRRILVTSIVAALCIYSIGARQRPNSAGGEVSGPVRSVRVERAELSKKAGKIEEGRRVPVSVLGYDRQGNLVESSINRPDGAQFKTYRARLEPESGRFEEAYYGPSGTLDTRFVNSYDPAANKAEIVEADSRGKTVARVVYRLDDLGRVAEEVRSDKDGHVSGRTAVAYDASGAKYEENSFDKHGQPRYRVVTTLSPRGQPVDEEYYRPDGSLVFRVHRTFDRQGNCDDEVYQSAAGGVHWRRDYEYDARGNWTKRRTFMQTMSHGLPEYEPVEATYRAIDYYGCESPIPTSESAGQRSRIRATRGLLSGGVVEQRAPFNPGRTVGTGVTGQIAVMMLIDETGRVAFAQCLSGFEKKLNDLAETVTGRWRYNPSLRGGLPVAVVSTTTITYKPDFR